LAIFKNDHSLYFIYYFFVFLYDTSRVYDIASKAGD